MFVECKKSSGDNAGVCESDAQSMLDIACNLSSSDVDVVDNVCSVGVVGVVVSSSVANLFFLVVFRIIPHPSMIT
eukprot:scaffold783_cov313-Chaetoceros_neogracile.AAC.4